MDGYSDLLLFFVCVCFEKEKRWCWKIYLFGEAFRSYPPLVADG
ncbi:hypothetical protein OROMI_023312 [Orobanche minor]